MAHPWGHAPAVLQEGVFVAIIADDNIIALGCPSHIHLASFSKGFELSTEQIYKE